VTPSKVPERAGCARQPLEEVGGRPNEGLHLTKSTPRFTAAGVAFAGEPRCSPDC